MSNDGTRVRQVTLTVAMFGPVLMGDVLNLIHDTLLNEIDRGQREGRVQVENADGTGQVKALWGFMVLEADEEE